MRGAGCGGDAPREEQVGQEREQHDQPHGFAQLHEREVRPGVLEDHGLVDHRELQVRARVVHGQPSGFGDDHDHEGDQGQNPLWRGQPGGMRERPRDDGRQVGGASGDREGEDRHEQGRLGQGPDRHGTACTHAPERRAGVEAAERQKDRAEKEEEDHREQVSGPAERGIGGQQRRDDDDHQGAGDEDYGGQGEDPACVLGSRPFTARQLAQVEQGLADRWPDPALHSAAHLAHEPEQERTTEHDEDHLQQRDGGHGDG